MKVCLARDRGLTMYSAVSGEKVAAIPELHSQPITQVWSRVSAILPNSILSILRLQLARSIVRLIQRFTLQVLFSADGQLLLTAGDKHVRVLHNVPGININIQVSSGLVSLCSVCESSGSSMSCIQELRAALRRNATNSAAKERIEQQIQAAELRLTAVSGS